MLNAIAERGDIIDVSAHNVGAISAQALAEGDLQALNDFAGIFSALCNALLQHGSDDRPASGSSSCMPPVRAASRPASAIPASKCAHPYADEPRADFWDMQRHTLLRMASKLDDHDERQGLGARRRGRIGVPSDDPLAGLDGMVVRIHRPHNEDPLDYGI